MPQACWKCGREHDVAEHDRELSATNPEGAVFDSTPPPGWHIKGAQNVWGKPNPDRHKNSRVISVRVDEVVYQRLLELIARSPLPHDTVGGYVRWLIEHEALRSR